MADHKDEGLAMFVEVVNHVSSGDTEDPDAEMPCGCCTYREGFGDVVIGGDVEIARLNAALKVANDRARIAYAGLEELAHTTWKRLDGAEVRRRAQELLIAVDAVGKNGGEV